MRPLLAITLLASLGCAAPSATLAGPRPTRVVVVSSSAADRPASRSLVDVLAGGEDPRHDLAREAERLLRARGYSVVGSVAATGAPTGEAVRQLVAREQADGALTIALARLDLTALAPLGRSEIDLDATLYDTGGTVLWSREHRGPTEVTTYRARADWRVHVREALQRAMRDLP